MDRFPLLGLVVTDRRGLVTGWTPGAERLLGHSAPQAVGRSVSQLLGVPDTEAGERHAPLSVRHRDGRRLRLPVSRYPLMSEPAGAPGSVLVFGPPGRCEPAERDALAEWVLHQSPLALTVYDTDLRCVAQNERMRGLSGMSDEERRGRRLTDVLAGPDAEDWQKRMRIALTTGEEQVGEIEGSMSARAGARVLGVSVTPLRDSLGQTLGVCTTVSDVTEARRARDRLALLTDASVRIGTTLDVSRTGQELTEVAVPRFADFARLDLLEVLLRGDEPAPGPLSGAVRVRRIAELAMSEGIWEVVSTASPADSSVYLEDSPAALCLATGRSSTYRTNGPVVRAWVAQSPDRQAKVAEHGAHSWLLVPVQARGTMLGVAMFARTRDTPEPFAEEDITLAEELVARAALALDNARRFTRERTAALTLQRSLLPQRLPEQSAVRFASRYLPATPRARVGGDWFDVIRLSGARVALVVGDVVGHGIHAAAAMGRLRTAVRTLADVDLAPDELLTRLDDLVIRLSAESGDGDPDLSGDSTDIGATCLYAVYDPVSGRCSLARAGHPSPAVVDPDGTARFLDLPAGPPLGLGGLPFESAEVTLPQGSLLALYTDGVVESRAHDLDVGLEALRAALTAPADSLEGLCDHVVGTLLPDGPADDAALLLVRPQVLDARRVAVWDVAADAAAVSWVRAESVRRLAAWGLDDAGDVTQLVVSELVTNAIRYGGSPIQLRLIYDRVLICEVSDSSSTAPHMRRARVLDEGGRGLMLVAQLTQRWGTRQTAAGKTIWCEQALPGTAGAPPGEPGKGA